MKKILLLLLMVLLLPFPSKAKTVLNHQSKVLTKGDSFTLILKNTKKKPQWKTGKKIVHLKKKKGKVLVKAQKTGQTKIIASVGRKKYVCKLTIENPKLSFKKKTLTTGQSVTLTLKGTKSTPVWKKTGPVSIQKKGRKVVCKMKKAGTATVTAKLRGHSYKAVFTIKAVKQTAKKQTTKQQEPTKPVAKQEPTKSSQIIEKGHPENLKHYFKVVDGKVYDVITGKEVPGAQVKGDHFMGDGLSKIDVSREWNETLEAVVDYDDAFNSKEGIFDAFDNTNGPDTPISTLGLGYSNKSYSVKVNRLAYYPYNSVHASVNTSYLRDDGMYVYQKPPKGDIFVAASGDVSNRHVTLMVNDRVSDYDLKEVEWYHRDSFRKIRFSNHHRIKYLKIYSGALSKKELEEDYEKSQINSSDIPYATDGIAGLGSPDAYTIDNGKLRWTEFSNPGIYEMNGKKIGIAAYQPDYRDADNSSYESVHIINKRNSILEGKQYAFSAYPYPFSLEKDFDIIWNSSNSDVASVYDGLLIAKKPGKTTITAGLSGTDREDSFEIEVVEKPEEYDNTFHVPSDFTSEQGDCFSDTDYQMTMRAIYAAVDKAKEGGYDHVIFPKQKFYASVFPDARYMYYVPSEMTIEFPEGSELHMMYEESMSRNNEFHVFEFGVPAGDYENECINSHLIIDSYFGERYDDFLDDGKIEEEKYIEEVRFAQMGRKARNCSVEIRSANYVTGYFITVDGTSSDPNKNDGVIYCQDMVSGRYDEEGNLTADANWISTQPFIPVPQKIKKDGYFLSAHGQNSYEGKYWPGTSARLYDILWFDSDKNLIESQRWHGICEYYTIPEEAMYFKVSLQQKELPVSEDIPYLAIHDNGSAKDCEIKNIFLNNSATGLFSVVGESDGLYIHDNHIDGDGKKRYDERTGDLENGWHAMRHSVITHNVCETGHFASGGHNAFVHTNLFGKDNNSEMYTYPNDELGRVINNRVSAFICAEKVQLLFYYNQANVRLWNKVKGWECIGILHDKFTKYY